MPGWLTVICGPMFAGKSTALIDLAERARQEGLRIIVLKPARDDRYDVHRVVTHDGRSLDALVVKDAESITAALMAHPTKPRDRLFVAVDEAHFFGDALVAPVVELVLGGAAVVVAGVERDHKGRAFAPFPHLLIEADEVMKLHARCSKCGQKAVHSQRMIADDSHIVVGGADMYEARCRACFQGGPG